MAANIAELLKKVEAQPALDQPRSKWVAFVPVVDALTQKGYSIWTAVLWLVAEGVIPDDNKRTAYHSILQHRKRGAK
jgi:hypothetical protein